MPNTAEHINQAQHNEAFFNSMDQMDQSVYSDWAMTVLFYTALHYVDALLAQHGILGPGGHDVRDNHVARQSELRPISHLYFRLKSRSRNARYYCRRFNQAEIQRAQNQDLEGIKTHLLPHLS